DVFRSHEIVLGDIVFSAPLLLDEIPSRDRLSARAGDHRAVRMQVVVGAPDQGARTLRVSSCTDGSDAHDAWSVHASARLLDSCGESAHGTMDLARFIRGAIRTVEAQAHYAECASRSIDFGPTFRGVRQLWLQER